MNIYAIIASMKKFLLLIIFVFLTINFANDIAHGALVSTRSYRIEQNKINKNEIKQIRELFKLHTLFANKHDLVGLKSLYYDKYINSDGFNREAYFASVKETWDECDNLTYGNKINSIDINGNNATAYIEEFAVGTIYDKIDTLSATGEIHAKSTSLYQLTKVNGKWLISGENMLTDESALLYGDARFMNIELMVPNQVGAGEVYTTAVKTDADENTVIVASIEHDPVIYPSKIPNGPLRTMPKTNILERFIKANSDNLNEYAVASLAISKSLLQEDNSTKVYMAGIACIMKRINVIPKNNFINLEGNK